MPLAVYLSFHAFSCTPLRNDWHTGPHEAPWDEYIPDDLVGTAWRGNTYKRAIARLVTTSRA